MRAQEFYERHGRSGFGGRIVAECWLRYEKALKAEKALDFDDLIAEPVRLLEEHADIRTLAQNRWQYLHIDEYQDTNELQERLAGILAEKHNNIFVVGDGDQAIYGWRGAKMENILNFDKKISNSANHHPRTQLSFYEESRRGGKCHHREEQESEREALDDRAGCGEPIILHLAGNAEAEARWIALKIRELMGQGIPPEGIAILFRTNFQSRALEEGLLRAGVPYKLLGTRFFGRKE